MSLKSPSMRGFFIATDTGPAPAGRRGSRFAHRPPSRRPREPEKCRNPVVPPAAAREVSPMLPNSAHRSGFAGAGGRAEEVCRRYLPHRPLRRRILDHNRDERRRGARRHRREKPLPRPTPPPAQAPRADALAGRNRNNRRTRLMALRDNPRLLGARPTPLSDAAPTFLRLTAGRSNERRVSSVMVGVALSLPGEKCDWNRISTRSQRVTPCPPTHRRGALSKAG